MFDVHQWVALAFLGLVWTGFSLMQAAGVYTRDAAKDARVWQQFRNHELPAMINGAIIHTDLALVHRDQRIRELDGMIRADERGEQKAVQQIADRIAELPKQSDVDALAAAINENKALLDRHIAATAPRLKGPGHKRLGGRRGHP